MDGAAHPVDGEGAIERRYGPTAAREWEHLRTLLDFATGFSLVVLIVPDADGAALCHRELARLLGAAGRSIRSHLPANPAELRAIAATLPHQPPGADIGAVWVECVVQASDPQFDTWRAAWRRMLEGLNQQRNPLREMFPTAVIFVAAPWLVPLFRECAPDLWSVRSQVVRLEPERQAVREPPAGRIDASDRRPERNVADSPDPDFALAQAARIMGDKHTARAQVLVRAAQGRLDRGQPREAEAILTDVLALPGLARDPALASVATHELGRALLDQGRAAEAEAAFRRALALAEEGGDTATARGVTTHELGRALLDQGRAAEAEALVRQALALQAEGGAPTTFRGITTNALGRALLAQGRATEATESFRLALTMMREGGARQDEIDIVQKRLDEAIQAAT